MGILDKFEDGVESAFEKAGDRVFRGPVQPAEIARRAVKQMKREKIVGSGRQHAPTLYTVLISAKDDKKLYPYYATMAAEIESFIVNSGKDANLSFDGRPLVRFIADPKLKSGRFDVIAEVVASPLIRQLRIEEAEYLGIKPKQDSRYGDEDDDFDAAESSGGGRRYRSDSQPQMSEQSQNLLLDLLADRDSSADDLLMALELARSQQLEAVGTNPEAAPPRPPLSDSASGAEPLEPMTPAAPAASNARLVDRASGREYALTHSEMTIGRGLENEITLNDRNASREHAVFRQSANGRWKVVDLGSTNGTLVNGQLQDQTTLKAHDELTIGVTVLEFLDD